MGGSNSSDSGGRSDSNSYSHAFEGNTSKCGGIFGGSGGVSWNNGGSCSSNDKCYSGYGGTRCSINDISKATNAENALNDTSGWGNQTHAGLSALGLYGSVNWNCSASQITGPISGGISGSRYDSNRNELVPTGIGHNNYYANGEGYKPSYIIDEKIITDIKKIDDYRNELPGKYVLIKNNVDNRYKFPYHCEGIDEISDDAKNKKYYSQASKLNDLKKYNELILSKKDFPKFVNWYIDLKEKLSKYTNDVNDLEIDRMLKLCNTKYQYIRSYNKTICSDPEVDKLIKPSYDFHKVCIDNDGNPTEFGKSVAKKLRLRKTESLDKELQIWKIFIEELIGVDGLPTNLSKQISKEAQYDCIKDEENDASVINNKKRKLDDNTDTEKQIKKIKRDTKSNFHE